MARTKIVNGAQIPLSSAEEAAVDAAQQDWADNVKPILERERTFETNVASAKGNYTDREIDILLAAYDETQRYRIDNTVTTPIIDAIQTVFPALTKLQIGTTIENRAQNYLTNAAIALANKIKDGG